MAPPLWPKWICGGRRQNLEAFEAYGSGSKPKSPDGTLKGAGEWMVLKPKWMVNVIGFDPSPYYSWKSSYGLSLIADLPERLKGYDYIPKSHSLFETRGCDRGRKGRSLGRSNGLQCLQWVHKPGCAEPPPQKKKNTNFLQSPKQWISSVGQ